MLTHDQKFGAHEDLSRENTLSDAFLILRFAKLVGLAELGSLASCAILVSLLQRASSLLVKLAVALLEWLRLLAKLAEQVQQAKLAKLARLLEQAKRAKLS